MCISTVWIAAGINPITQQKGYLCTYFQHRHIMKHWGSFRNFIYRELFFYVSKVISPKALISHCCIVDTNHEPIVLIVWYCPMCSPRGKLLVVS